MPELLKRRMYVSTAVPPDGRAVLNENVFPKSAAVTVKLYMSTLVSLRVIVNSPLVGVTCIAVASVLPGAWFAGVKMTPRW